MKSFSLLCLSAILACANAADILIVAPMPAYSHFSVAFRIAKKLAEQNHQVTCINPYPQKVPIKNYNDVSVEENVQAFEEAKKSMFERNTLSLLENLTTLFDLIIAVSEKTLANKNVQELLKSEKTFDLIIVEHFFDEVYTGLGHRFKAPVILLSPMPSSAMTNYMFANPAPISYVPGMGGTLTKNMNFLERIQNLLMHSVFNSLIQFYHLPQQKRLFQKYIDPDSDFDSSLYNVSLMLTNSHVSVTDAVPHVPSIIEIGGFHIEEKKLPEVLQDYLDKSTEGVVLFSMGSNLKSKDLKPEVRAGIIKAFGKLKEKVLWKFETDLPEAPDNVKVMQWLPQQDVLAHPNVKAFISHGGLLSTIEAVYFGVPVVGIPVFGDQKHNIANAVKNGFAVQIDLSELSEETLSRALNEILNNNSYRNNIQQRSKLMRDQPIKPIDSALYWIEHVIRHKGALHLRSAGLDLNWFQRELVDVLLFLSFVVILATVLFYLLIKKLKNLVVRPQNKKDILVRHKKDL